MPRIWMTADTIRKFRFLSELEVDLRNDLRKFMEDGVSPTEYGPRLLCSPKISWLKLTSKKHMTNAKAAEMDFSGAKPQTTIFDNDVAIQRRNFQYTDSFLSGLGNISQLSHDSTALCWKNVPLSYITENLLIDKLSFSTRSRVFNEIETFCQWLKKLSDEDGLENWSVVLAGNVKIAPEGPCDQKHWCFSGMKLGKVNRSRRVPHDETDQSIDIGALRALKDLVADVDHDIVKGFGAITKQEHVDTIRKKGGMDKTPILIIYRIDGQSKVQSKSEDRIDMDFPCDITRVCHLSVKRRSLPGSATTICGGFVLGIHTVS